MEATSAPSYPARAQPAFTSWISDPPGGYVAPAASPGSSFRAGSMNFNSFLSLSRAAARTLRLLCAQCLLPPKRLLAVAPCRLPILPCVGCLLPLTLQVLRAALPRLAISPAGPGRMRGTVRVWRGPTTVDAILLSMILECQPCLHCSTFKVYETRIPYVVGNVRP